MREKLGAVGIVMILLVVPQWGQLSQAVAGKEEGGRYYAKLCELVTRRSAPPRATSAECVKIVPEKMFMGVRFGGSMDDVVALWGKPDRIRMMMDKVEMAYFGGLTFAFEGNRLVEGLAQRIAGVHIVDGPALGDSVDAVKKTMGMPARRDVTKWEEVWTYETVSSTLELTFYDGKLGVIAAR